MSDVQAWVTERVDGAPEPLLKEMLAALPADAEAKPEALAAAALALYRRVAEGAGGREDALPLLAADALFTLAFEAQAADDPDGLALFAERWGAAGRLGEVAR